MVLRPHRFSTRGLMPSGPAALLGWNESMLQRTLSSVMKERPASWIIESEETFRYGRLLPGGVALQPGKCVAISFWTVSSQLLRRSTLLFILAWVHLKSLASSLEFLCSSVKAFQESRFAFLNAALKARLSETYWSQCASRFVDWKILWNRRSFCLEDSSSSDQNFGPSLQLRV